MKKSAWLFVSMMAAFVACKDDEEAPNAISSDEAAVMMSSSLASNSSGFASVSKEAANKSEDIVDENSSGRVATCGVSQNIDLSGSSPVSGAITWSYDFSYKFRLNCSTQEAPESITASLTYNGAYDSPSAAFEYSGLSEVALTGLAEAETNFLLNGFYKRSGSFEIKEGEKKSGSGNTELTLTDVEVSKETHKISTGTAKLLLSGSVSEKGSFKYEATVEFLGNDSANLTIKSEVYVVNLVSGEVTKK